jgi:hypothetical protein
MAYTGQDNIEKCGRISMHQTGFEYAILVFVRSRSACSLDRAVNLIGLPCFKNVSFNIYRGLIEVALGLQIKRYFTLTNNLFTNFILSVIKTVHQRKELLHSPTHTRETHGSSVRRQDNGSVFEFKKVDRTADTLQQSDVTKQTPGIVIRRF